MDGEGFFDVVLLSDLLLLNLRSLPGRSPKTKAEEVTRSIEEACDRILLTLGNFLCGPGSSVSTGFAAGS